MKSRLLFLLALLCTTLPAQTYVPALPGYHYQFPRDNFNHPEYRTEWWYYTGNLQSKDGHRFGFELTFFRQGVPHEASTSPWEIRDLFMAHLALSDISGKHYYQAERINRAGPGLAGIDEARGLVWNGNWHTQIGQEAHHLQGIGDAFAFDLTAEPQKPPVIQGTNGISQKAEGRGHASHYISYTRMKTSGKVRLQNATFQVEGDAWMDHEFFTETPDAEQVGWDWVSLELNNGNELMLYRLRHSDGTIDPYSSGTYIDRSGTSSHLTMQDISMTPAGAAWKSSRTGADYPVSWNVAIPRLQLQLHLQTPLQDQEFVSRIGPSYWEGAIDATGMQAGSAVRGSGYLELTGYASHRSPLIPEAGR